MASICKKLLLIHSSYPKKVLENIHFNEIILPDVQGRTWVAAFADDVPAFLFGIFDSS